MQLTVRLVTIVASYASIFGLYFTVSPLSVEKPAWHVGLLIFSFFLCALLLILEIRNHIVNLPKQLRSSSQIQKYMHSWISNDGRVVILSRDLSWAENNAEIQSIMIGKASRRELTILVENETELTKALRDAGATTIYYGSFGFVPAARFTIVDYEKIDARVAIGTRAGNIHNVKEHTAASSVEFYLANDLVRLLTAWNARGVQNNQ